MNDRLSKNELVAKAKKLFAEVKYAPPLNLFLIESLLANKNATEEDLEKLCNTLEEHNQKQDEIYAEYKVELKNALTDYLKKTQKSPKK
ncbi:MAG: hypothetical protein ACD_66C00049G0002 [uncultured bacterium]|uniref:Uncharacterized protein n=1 Tax=Candidatus Gottesmanbacteria bacterium GW2011_GWB1_43_11 TaxID=1618446 RepID=A0A0G1CMK6_9BACT|nr:MAG: hypothetical protein ACD_66C00049G0002 [uncultured bacterium]KKS41589.1 MAG: hypothetical protein UV04_C0006G0012 [Candidatus Gottesmanbacteria bacterium GW2011_GWA2_42_16]KKS55863.1 MAG: hypothetical protein UV17_C0006G0020 [Candidatus Gottesmanbacteria bacterium GW2011_GWA1_42_26]KKS81264.1 MAG: hypothetical protein UV55_C0017G0021 [Candidatus Gottesmanbacteria bacterium GW2011_GWC1_43_10]KKS86754.1 MAG: hypothetical protein UV61_C0007G0012 [Candidatus Gottesmanbacteria bacterium GW20